jgi:hypothetical protein
VIYAVSLTDVAEHPLRRNRMSPLRLISLLGCKRELIQPLCTSGPGESARGDPGEVTIAEWAQRCVDQGGLVVLPHAQAARPGLPPTSF